MASQQLSTVAIVVIVVLSIMIFVGLSYVLFTRSSVHNAGGDENSSSELRDYRSIFQIICCCQCNSALQNAQPIDSPNKKNNRNSMEKYWSSDYSISGLTMSQSERRGTHKDSNIKKLKYKPTASVSKDGHRIRLQPDTDSPKIDVLKRTAILITTEQKTVGSNVWGKVDESLLTHDGKSYPGFEVRHHGWTLMMSGTTVYWEALEEYVMPPRNSSSTGLGSAAFHLGDEEEALGSAKHHDLEAVNTNNDDNRKLNSSTRSSNSSSNSSGSQQRALKMSTNREGNPNYELAAAASKERSSFMWLGSREESIVNNNGTNKANSSLSSAVDNSNKAGSSEAPVIAVGGPGSRITSTAGGEGADEVDD